MRRNRSCAYLIACAAVFMLASTPVLAATLFRCVAQDGAVAYQDVPCDGDSVLTRTLPIMNAAGAGEVGPRKSVSRKATTGVRSKQAAAVRPVRGERAKQRDACQAARKARDANLARLGLRRTFEHLQTLDVRVYEACRGL